MMTTIVNGQKASVEIQTKRGNGDAAKRVSQNPKMKKRELNRNKRKTNDFRERHDDSRKKKTRGSERKQIPEGSGVKSVKAVEKLVEAKQRRRRCGQDGLNENRYHKRNARGHKRLLKTNNVRKTRRETGVRRKREKSRNGRPKSRNFNYICALALVNKRMKRGKISGNSLVTIDRRREG